MTLLAHLGPLQDADADRRGVARRKLTLDSQLVCVGAEVIIHDLSVTGLLLETDADLETGESISVQLPEAGPAEAVVVWCNGRLFGCEFREPVARATVSAALLQSEPQASGTGDQPSLATTDDRAKDQGIWARRWGFALALLTAIAFFASAYLIATAALQLVALCAAVLAVLLLALVAWGNAILDDLPM